VLAEAAGYYLRAGHHFLVTPLVLAWLYLRRSMEFARLRSGLVLDHRRRERGVLGLAGRPAQVSPYPG